MHGSWFSLIHYGFTIACPPHHVTPHESVLIITDPASVSHASKPSAQSHCTHTAVTAPPCPKSDDRVIGHHVADHDDRCANHTPLRLPRQQHLHRLPGSEGSNPRFLIPSAHLPFADVPYRSTGHCAQASFSFPDRRTACIVALFLILWRNPLFPP